MTDQVNVLYRFYSAAGELLYVGITNDPWRRFSQHRSEKDWWAEVSTICQQSFETSEALKYAEKKAIRSENPRYNKQFARAIQSEHPCYDTQFVTTEEDAPVASEERRSTLVGKFFHTWREPSGNDYDIIRNGKAVLWQGQIVDQIGAQEFLIQLFSWLDGKETEKKIAAMAEMFNWTFYDNSIEMVSSLGCSDHIGPDHSRCGRMAAYMVGFEELGLSAVCNSCVKHYSEARPILWRNGVLELGKASR